MGLRLRAEAAEQPLADGHELPPRLPQVLAPEQARLHVRGVKAPPLLDGRQGLPRLAPVEHARRLPLQHPLHGAVHVAVPVEGQKAHGAVLLQRRIVAVHQVALRAQHAHRRVAPHAELSHLLGGDAEAPPVVAQHGVEVRAHLLHAQLQQLGQLPGHAERLVLEGARQHVLLVRELQDGAARVQRGLHLLPDPLRHLLLHEVRRVPRGVVLVAEEALAQLGQPVLSALQGAHELLLPVAQQDVVVGPLADEGLVVVEVLAGRPQAQVGVVVLPRAGQLPVRA